MKNRMQIEVLRHAGVRAVRIIDHAGATVEEHAHDWPVVSLFVFGSYTNRTDAGEVFVSANSAMIYRAGQHHANVAGAQGLEQIDLEFDPAWAGAPELNAMTPVRCCIGGSVAAQSRRLVELLSIAKPDPSALRRGLQTLLAAAAHHQGDAPCPTWFAPLASMIDANPTHRLKDHAKALDVSPVRLGQAYRKWAGETLAQTVGRKRMETAAHLLRTSQFRTADIAAMAGFSDQSHMTRAFRTILGRTPHQVRGEAAPSAS